MRQPASLPSCHTPSRTAPADSPRVVRLLVSLCCEGHTAPLTRKKPIPHTTRKNAREWQRLWRGGEIITEINGDDPRMPRARTCLQREALTPPPPPAPPPPDALVPVSAAPAALIVRAGWQIEGLPDIVRRAGPQAAERTVARRRCSSPPKRGCCWTPSTRRPFRGLRDRALLAVMVYSFARVSAVVGMRVEDYYQQGKRWWLRLQEKGGKHHAVPAGTPQGGGLSRRGRDRGRARPPFGARPKAPLWRSMPRAGSARAG